MMFWSKQHNLLAQIILYRGNVLFLHCILNGKMINYSRIPPNVFTKYFPENFKWKPRTKITNKSSSFDSDVGCGFRTLIICILSSKWLDTEGQSSTKFSSWPSTITYFFLTKYASNPLLPTWHYLSRGFSVIRKLYCSLNTSD